MRSLLNLDYLNSLSDRFNYAFGWKTIIHVTIQISIIYCNFKSYISSHCRADCSNADKPGAIPQHNGLTPFGKVGVLLKVAKLFEWEL